MGKKGWVALWLAGLLLLGQAEQLPAVPADGTAALSQQRYVALTFDDGPKRETTARLLDGLRERGCQCDVFSDRAADPGPAGSGGTYEGGRTSGGEPHLEPYSVGNDLRSRCGRARKSKKRIRCCGRSWGMGPIGFARLTAQFKMHRNRRFRCLWSLGQWIPGIGSP